MKKEKHIIWTSDLGDLNDWRDAWEDGADLSEAELYDRAADLNAEYFSDETDYNLAGAALYNPVMVLADLGLWDGRRTGYQVLNVSNVGEAIRRAGSWEDGGELYIDDLGDLRITQPHHDGTNYLLLREFKDDVSEAARKNLLNKIYYGTVTRKDITRVTRRLGDDVAAVYGWRA